MSAEPWAVADEPWPAFLISSSGDGTGFEKLRVAAGHMPMLASTLAGAITKQFSDRFPTTAAATDGAGLPQTD